MSEIMEFTIRMVTDMRLTVSVITECIAVAQSRRFSYCRMTETPDALCKAKEFSLLKPLIRLLGHRCPKSSLSELKWNFLERGFGLAEKLQFCAAILLIDSF